MKDFFKNKFVTVLVVVATVILAGVAVFTAMRLYELRSQSVSPTSPESEPAAKAPVACKLLTFTISTPTPSPTGTLTPTPSTTATPTPTKPIGGPSETPTPTTVTVTPTLPPPPPPPEAPGCPAQKPEAPIITSVTKNGTEATLTWTSVSLATHYTISYGTSATNLEYGVPNTGNVTTFTVKSLNPTGTYYFTVYAVNDCMPSEGSTLISTVEGTSTKGEEPLPQAGVSIPTLFGLAGGALLIIFALLLAI